MLGLTLARRFNLPTTFVGVPQAPLASTLWDEQLSAARGDLHAFADALHAQMGRGERCITHLPEGWWPRRRSAAADNASWRSRAAPRSIEVVFSRGGTHVSDTLAKVKSIIGKFAKNKPALETAGADTKIRKDLGVSSANLVDVVLDFEEAFNLSIADDELAKINTLGDAVSLIEAKRGKK